MLTPQEVEKRTFAKAMMGGYNLAEVDEFLETVTADYTLLYRENAALKSKMKVLAEKVEEYRATEDEIRSTLYAAQKKADGIVQDAEQKAKDILHTAEGNASEEIAAIRAKVAEEENRLAAAKRNMADFAADWRRVLSEQEDFLTRLPDLPLPAAEDRAALSDMDRTRRFSRPAEEEEQPVPAQDSEPTKVFTIPTEPQAEKEEQPAPAVSEPKPEEKGGRSDEEVIEVIRAIMRETGDDLKEVSIDGSKPRPPLIEGEDESGAEYIPDPEDDVRVFDPNELKFGKNRDKQPEE